MSLFGHAASRTGTHIDQYDHEISLADHTKSQEPAPDPDVDAQAAAESSRGSSPSSSREGLSKRISMKITRTTLREELTKRKYAKWQEGRFAGSDDEGGNDEAESQAGASTAPLGPTATTETRDSNGTKYSNVETSDFAQRQSTEEQGRLRTMGKKITDRFSAPKPSKHKKQADAEVDILYENQRGWFVFGIPLYSHKSLLNLDPAPWLNREFKDSPVNITNAQLPDPSWEWAWKQWYVDMSYDVDEEGWQYSFGFSPKWSWHGTHPWFHNFVRRRRWLRKRVKRSTRPVRGRDGSIQQAHMLNPDYFTIHGTTAGSRETSAERETLGRSSYRSRASTKGEEYEIEPSEIKDINALMKVLRHATVDREKIDAVKKFIDQGGEEIFYLEEQIPQIMSMFIFQNSRRQLLSYLLSTVKEARAHREGHAESGGLESENEKRRIDNLLKAIRVADEQVRNLEFWSDVKGVEKGQKGEEKLRLSRGTSTEEGLVAQVEDITPGLTYGKEETKPDKDMGREIKGIPDEAGLEQGGLKAVLDSGGPERDEGPQFWEDTEESKDGEIQEKDEKQSKKTTESKGKEKAVNGEDVPPGDTSVD